MKVDGLSDPPLEVGCHYSHALPVRFRVYCISTTCESKGSIEVTLALAADFHTGDEGRPPSDHFGVTFDVANGV